MDGEAWQGYRPQEVMQEQRHVLAACHGIPNSPSDQEIPSHRPSTACVCVCVCVAVTRLQCVQALASPWMSWPRQAHLQTLGVFNEP